MSLAMNRKLVSSLIIVAALGSQDCVQAQGVFQKTVGKMAKLAGKTAGAGIGMFGSTEDLHSVTPLIIYRTNLYPKGVGAMEIDMFGKGWKGGDDAIQMQFTKKHGIKMTKLEGGSVTIDGKAADFQDLGVYTYINEPVEGPRKVEITAGNGEKASFVLTPDKPIKLVSINGQTGDNIAVDLTKDVTLEFENAGPADGAWIQVSLTGTILGLRTFYEVGNFKPAQKIVIPAAAFVHTNLSGNNVSLKNTYLQIARTSWEYATECSGQYKSVPYVLGTLDGRFIKTDKPDFSDGLKSEDELKGKDVSYAFSKPVAAISRPFSQAKKIGVAAFGIRGTSSVEKNTTDRMAGTTTEVSATFNPSNEFLDGILAKLYPEIVAATQTAFNAQVIDPETVAKTTAWKNAGIMSETDDGTPTSFARSYKTGKILSELALKMDGYKPTVDEKTIAQETNTDALLRCVLDLELAIDGTKVEMTPVLHYTLYGAPNGVNVFPSVYVEGKAKGKAAKVNKKTSDAELIEIINAPELVNALKASLADLKEKEKQDGAYELLWSMQ